MFTAGPELVGLQAMAELCRGGKASFRQGFERPRALLGPSDNSIGDVFSRPMLFATRNIGAGTLERNFHVGEGASVKIVFDGRTSFAACARASFITAINSGWNLFMPRLPIGRDSTARG